MDGLMMKGGLSLFYSLNFLQILFDEIISKAVSSVTFIIRPVASAGNLNGNKIMTHRYKRHYDVFIS